MNTTKPEIEKPESKSAPKARIRTDVPCRTAERERRVPERLTVRARKPARTSWYPSC